MPGSSPARPHPADPTREVSTRDRIVSSALRLFADHGFAGTTVKRIALDAGVSQGLMYTYFNSKDDLLRDIFSKGMNDVLATLESRDDAGDPLDAIEELLLHSFAVVEEHSELWRILYALRTQSAVLERLGLEMNAFTDQIEERLAALCARAGLSDPEIEAKILFALVDGANQHRTLRSRPYPVKDVVLAVMAKYRAQLSDQK